MDARNSPQYFNWVYGKSIYLRYGLEVAKSERGVRQEDLLGHLFFCLGIQVILANATDLIIPVDAYAAMHGEAEDILKYIF